MKAVSQTGPLFRETAALHAHAEQRAAERERGPREHARARRGGEARRCGADLGAGEVRGGRGAEELEVAEVGVRGRRGRPGRVAAAEEGGEVEPADGDARRRAVLERFLVEGLHAVVAGQGTAGQVESEGNEKGESIL